MTILVEFNFVENEKRCFISDVRVAACGVFFIRHPDESRDLFNSVVNQRDPVLQRGDGVFSVHIPCHPAEARDLFESRRSLTGSRLSSG